MYSQKFVDLFMGGTSRYPIPFEKGAESNPEDIDMMLQSLTLEGYTIVNIDEVSTLTKNQIEEFAQNFQVSKKAGYILRKTFMASRDFVEYTQEEWDVIFAQYALTYGWEEFHDQCSERTARQVMIEYTEGEVTSPVLDFMSDIKPITISFRSNTIDYIQGILNSPTVLRTHQRTLLEECPTDILAEAATKANITINETKILVVKLLRNAKQSVRLFKNPTDVLRYILAVHAKVPFEGQITKPVLKKRHLQIPTADRKFLLDQLNQMNPRNACEDMFKYESYWKIVSRYLRFGKMKTSRIRYPKYHAAIDLLYDGDRSWTFNGRYSKALADLDYAAALDVAKERPGFLLRNMFQFLRYPVGAQVAVLAENATVSLEPGATPVMDKKIKTDKVAFFTSEEFRKIIQNAAPKLAFQILGNLESDTFCEAQKTREVQGRTVAYIIPQPAIRSDIRRAVIRNITKALREKLNPKNSQLGKIYIDPDVDYIPLQYSGRNSTELNYSGQFLTPGARVPIPNGDILRMGVMWRGQSTDIDHNVVLFEENVAKATVYFGNPEWKNIVTSSGDITSCGSNKFSVELIDMDIEGLREEGITSAITSLFSYTGGQHTIGKLECYLFMKTISSSSRVHAGRSVNLDLMDTDYAIRLDPENTDNALCYYGFSVDLAEDTVQVAAIPQKGGRDGNYRNIVDPNDMTPEKLLKHYSTQYSLYSALMIAVDTDQLVLEADLADIRISPDGDIDPYRDMEKIEQIIFA